MGNIAVDFEIIRQPLFLSEVDMNVKHKAVFQTLFRESADRNSTFISFSHSSFTYFRLCSLFVFLLPSSSSCYTSAQLQHISRLQQSRCSQLQVGSSLCQSQDQLNSDRLPAAILFTSFTLFQALPFCDLCQPACLTSDRTYEIRR